MRIGVAHKNFRCRASSRPGWKKKAAQVTMEFAFTMILVTVLMAGMVRIFLWSGKDLVNRRKAHEAVLLQANNPIRPVFYYSTPMDDATVDSNIWGNDALDWP